MHQTRWSIRVRTDDLEELWPGHVPTAYPTLGIWKVEAYLTARPFGDFEFLIGPSPAYDLGSRSAAIAGVTFVGPRPARAAPAAKPPDTAAARPGWRSRVRSWLLW